MNTFIAVMTCINAMIVCVVLGVVVMKYLRRTHGAWPDYKLPEFLKDGYQIDYSEDKETG